MSIQSPTDSDERFTVQQVAFDDYEKAILEITRPMMRSLADPRSEGWLQAFDLALVRFPAPFGATIAHAIAIALREARRERTEPFQPTFSGLPSEDERHFISAFKAIRVGDIPRARLHGLLLCGGGDASALLAALERLAIISGDADGEQYG